MPSEQIVLGLSFSLLVLLMSRWRESDREVDGPEDRHALWRIRWDIQQDPMHDIHLSEQAEDWLPRRTTEKGQDDG